MNKSFTLIEILVVIVVIGVLSAFILVGMSSISQKANFAKGQAFINSMDNSLLLARVSQWKFDELTTAIHNTTTIDSWGSNTGTLSTSDGSSEKLSTNCPSGKCISFDGNNDYAYVSGSDSASSNLAITGAITLSVWVKFNDIGTNGAIVGRGAYRSSNGNYGYGLSRRNDTNAIKFDTYSTTTRDTLDSVFIFNDSNWHLIAGTWDGTTNLDGKKIYVDGVLNKSGTSGISLMGQPNYTFRIGENGAGSYPLNGSIDDVRVYNQAIPISEIQQNYFVGINNLYKNGGLTQIEYTQRLTELKTNLTQD
jgi:prepilin-type N-terminal cleavage/methylation domain-containing protein